MPIAIASGCAPEQERGILTRSPVLFQAPRPRSPPACSPSKTLVVFVPAYNNPRHRPPNPHERFVRDSQIPIGRARPTSPQPPRGFLLGRLSDAGPATRTTVLQGAGIRNPSPRLSFAASDRMTGVDVKAAIAADGGVVLFANIAGWSSRRDYSGRPAWRMPARSVRQSSRNMTPGNS